jgi:hypothetical protein
MAEQAAHLREQALRCRRLAGGVGDEAMARALGQMAAEYEERAQALEQKAMVPLPNPKQ